MEPYTVQAEYSFQRQNNDELQFKKGDIITVTQCEDGGWWEGTLGDMTGWFPSNYVKEYKGSFEQNNWRITRHENNHFLSCVYSPSSVVRSGSGHRSESIGCFG